MSPFFLGRIRGRIARVRRGAHPSLRSPMIQFIAMIIALSFPEVLSFVVPSHVQTMRRYPSQPAAGTSQNTIHLQPRANTFTPNRIMSTANTVAMDNAQSKRDPGIEYTWSPQDLTKDSPGFLPIPDDDYVKKYQKNPVLWPVEFFLIVYRRTKNKKTLKSETQILVRESANGTSKWGVGTGVPATRWVLSTQERPPLGYKWSETPSSMQEPSRISFEASNFPEFPRNGQKSWTYNKIDIREDAFNGPGATEFKDPELEEYANKIRNDLRIKLSEKMNDGKNLNLWESCRNSVVKKVVDNANSVAAIHGTLRMSGLFARREISAVEQQNDIAAVDGPRYVSLDKNAPDPSNLVQSVRIFTMFPQMPDPMPLPSTPPEELQKEIASRESRMAESGRDPHKDRYGRKFTHKSTSNVSNTIHGVYFTLDATDLPGLDEVPALDLFGTKKIKREWKSLEDLKVLHPDGNISTEDTKPTFISGFIVRQLVKDEVIDIHG